MSAVADQPLSPASHTADEPAIAAEAAAPTALGGDPALIGLPSFIVGAFALGLTQVGYLPAEAVGGPIAIIMMATGIFQTVAAGWAAALGQSAVASVFGIFGGFWLSYAALVLGLVHNWYGIPAADVVRTQGVFLIAWLATVIMLTLASLRLPMSFTVLFVLVDLALAFVLLGTLNASPGLVKIGGYCVFAFALIGVYLYFNVMDLATGGKGLPLGSPLRK